MEILCTVIATLVVYSLISTITYLITDENEEVITGFGLGIVGLLLAGTIKMACKIVDIFKYHIGKRSIFIEENTGNKYKCKPKDADDIYCWVWGYKLTKKYAKKSEWVGIPDFSKEFIEISKRNCDNCKYDKECLWDYPYERIKCKHDEFGRVLEFDKFEKS